MQKYKDQEKIGKGDRPRYRFQYKPQHFYWNKLVTSGSLPGQHRGQAHLRHCLFPGSGLCVSSKEEHLEIYKDCPIQFLHLFILYKYCKVYIMCT